VAIIARDPVVITLTGKLDVPIVRDPIGTGGGAAPVVSNQVPLPGAIGQLPNVTITFEID